MRLYRAFLSDLAARFEAAPFPFGWYVTPADAWPEIAAHAGRVGSPPLVVAQGEGNWTERQRRLFREADTRG